MNDDYGRKPNSRECPEPTDDPATQPKPPTEGDCCEDPESPEAPCLDNPKAVTSSTHCKCPTGTGTGPSSTKCLEDLITAQNNQLLLADRAKKSKEELEKLLANAKAGSKVYTRDMYEELIKLWRDEDLVIAELVRKLVCCIPCWRCVVECHICPLLEEIRIAEKWLYDDGKIPREVYTLYDLQYWHQTNVNALTRRLYQIQSVLTAWSNPAVSIKGAITDTNKKLIDAAYKALGNNEPGKAVFDVFLKLIPLHLAIAPPAGVATTRIAKKFTTFCDYPMGNPDDCCGPDLGEGSLRQRLIGPQAYLIDPTEYYKVICCIIKHYYAPAKDLLNKAETDKADVDARIAANRAKLTGWAKAVEEASKAAIPGVVDCCKYCSTDDHSHAGVSY